MDDCKELCRLWQSALPDLRPQSARGGWVRCIQWVTGMVRRDEEHTITQILTSPGLESRWRAVESFVEFRSWDRPPVERHLLSPLRDRQPPRWGKYRKVAADDTKEHRISAEVRSRSQ